MPSDPRKGRGGLAASVVVLAGLMLAGPAVAHRTTPLTAEEAAGLEIAGLTHGEMGHVAAYRSAIVDLAARQFPTDETFRRLLNHANIQFSYCAWGLVPNALTDEENPFNECSHAYLAAYRAVLARMAEMPGQPQAATALADRIDAEIRADPEALCQYSVEPFYTGTVLSPTLAAALGYPPIALAAAAFALMLVALALGQLAKRRRSGHLR
jgi:hypothetical protein